MTLHAALFATTTAVAALVAAPQAPVLRSPDGQVEMAFALQDGVLTLRLGRKGEAILAPSSLGLTFVQGGPLQGLRLEAVRRRHLDETWTPVWGTASRVRNRAEEVEMDLREARGLRRRVTVIARAADDGAAFRYVVPAQAALPDASLQAETTTFRFAQDATAWWIPAGVFADEALHRETPLSQAAHVNTPMTLRTAKGQVVSLHEAQLLDYSEMTLKRTGGTTFQAHLWPWPDGVAVKAKGAFRSPWRALTLGDRPGDLLESHFIQNLNDPCRFQDTSWIRPMKFVGIWWGMHTKAWTWEEGPRHGATTERTKAAIDFAARHGIEAVLAEGWNRGWETWGAAVSEQDYLQAARDFDLDEVVRYAQSKGVAFLGHHETGGNIPMYERQVEAAFELCERKGIGSVKTGYAGPIVPAGMHHHGQWMVNHFQRVVETAARHRVTLNVHEGIKPTGLDRTWPNLMCTEGARGMEWNATLDRNPPRHDATLPYTRFLAGPYDATPGIFKLDFAPERGLYVQSTLARQLALYVVFHSPLMMLADRIEAYEGHPAFRFLEQVPCTWDETRGLEAELGRTAAVARRRGSDWYLGAINADQLQEVAYPLDFLVPGKTYVAEFYVDAREADWRKRPGAVEITRCRVTSADTLRAVLPPAGGLAVRLTPGAGEGLPTLAATLEGLAERRKAFGAVERPGDLTEPHDGVGAQVVLATAPHPAYARGHLTDGRVASGGYQEPEWLGFEGADLRATLTLAGPRDLQEVSLRLLHDPDHWIQLPARVDVEGSLDGHTWIPLASLQPSLPAGLEQRTLSLVLPSVPVRQLRITAVQRPLAPGHLGHGKPGFLFCDEVVLRERPAR